MLGVVVSQAVRSVAEAAHQTPGLRALLSLLHEMFAFCMAPAATTEQAASGCHFKQV
jgi:hypothetical protein